MMDPLARIREQVTNNPVIIYMKGTPQFPRCGFSARAAQALQACNVEFAYVNVFEETEIYENLPRFANWPTFPQVYVGGELIGGCDIVVEMFERGELAKLVAQASRKNQSVEGH